MIHATPLSLLLLENLFHPVLVNPRKSLIAEEETYRTRVKTSVASQALVFRFEIKGITARSMLQQRIHTSLVGYLSPLQKRAWPTCHTKHDTNAYLFPHCVSHL